MLDFLLNLVSPLIAVILFSAFVICLVTQPGGTIAITIALVAIVVLFQACQAFNEHAAVSAQNKNEVKYNELVKQWMQLFAMFRSAQRIVCLLDPSNASHHLAASFKS